MSFRRGTPASLFTVSLRVMPPTAKSAPSRPTETSVFTSLFARRGVPSEFQPVRLVETILIGSSAALSPMTGVAEREPEAFERFDALFPPKEKLRLPGQIF